MAELVSVTAKDEGQLFRHPIKASLHYSAILFCYLFSRLRNRVRVKVFGRSASLSKMLLRAVVLLGAAFLVHGGYDVSEKMLFPVLPSGAIRAENTVCKEESQNYMLHLENLTLWAHESE